MLLDHPKDLYVSTSYWEKFLNSFFIPTFTTSQSVLVGLPGTGVMALLKYTARNTEYFQEKLLLPDRTRILIFLSLDSFLEKEDTARLQLLESLHVFITIHEAQFSNKNMYDTAAKLQSCTEIISYLTNELGLRVTLILSELQYFKNTASKISQLRNIRSDRINTVYVIYQELTDTSIPKEFGYLSTLYYFPLFDYASVLRYIAQIMLQEGTRVEAAVQEQIEKYAGGDGTVVKTLTYKAVVDPDFCRVLVTGSVEAVWNYIGEAFFTKRYHDLLGALTKESRMWLKTREGTTPEYIAKTGLFVGDGSLFSSLFAYFLDKYPESLTDSVIQDTKDFDISLLTGKEFELYRYLNDHTGIVSKSELASKLWSEQAGETFSLWTLDKLLSNLRKKLVKYNSVQHLIVIRQKGVQLV